MIKMIGNLFNTDERNFNGLGSTQCGNWGIFMPPFYMKSILLANIESQKDNFGTLNFNFWKIWALFDGQYSQKSKFMSSEIV